MVKSPFVYHQAAFECMYTLLDTCLDRLDIFEFLSHVEDGLKDHYDIKVSTITCLLNNAILRKQRDALLRRVGGRWTWCGSVVVAPLQDPVTWYRTNYAGTQMTP